MFKNFKKFSKQILKTNKKKFEVVNNSKRFLNIHEYSSKEIMTKYNIKHQRGIVVKTHEEARQAAEKVKTEYNSKNFIVKSQILAGGRGKGVFDTGYKGGVKFTKSVNEVEEVAKNMLGNHLVTKQTGKEGVKVQKLFIAECLDFEKEYYFAIVLDRGHQSPVMVASKEGGMDIEEVAEKNPNAIAKEPIDIKTGPTKEQTGRLAKALGLEGDAAKQCQETFEKLYQLFVENDATQIEINPLVQTNNGDIVCVDGKMNFDDNAEFRRKEIFEMRDFDEEDPREVQASKFGLSYIGLDGNIGCLVNGAGLAMSTMDIIKLYGGEPANFLDVGGGASSEQVKEALKIITSDKRVKAILVNIFGGIMKCDIIAKGILDAVKQVDIQVPITVRLSGTRSAEGQKLLNESGLKFITASDLDDAAKKAVKSIQ